MDARRHLLLRFNANITSYEVTVYGCQTLREQFYSSQGCICLCNPSPCLRIVARPLVEGYSTLLYYWIDTTRREIANFYFNFPANQTPTPVGVNNFTLTDRTYGLPIDGSLLFTQA